MNGIIIIGAGQAGASLAEKLRSDGFAGAITLIGGEPVPPYERPPLSKAYLLGESEKERLFLRPEAIYREKDITLKLGEPVSAINTIAKTVRVAGEDLTYDQLALTTGSDPIQLPPTIGGALDGVFTVRTLADIDTMAPRFTKGAKVLVVGGGYIGLEAAAVASKLGLQVTLVEMAERILGRVAAAETADVIRTTHQDKGVDIRENVGLARLLGQSAVSGAELSDGTILDVDFVIAGIGIRPSTALAEAAGIACENGISVDAYGRTSARDVWAAGDCTSFPYQGGTLRLESVQNAIDQAQNVAMNMLGADKAYVPYPWFWSDQYDLKLQIAGLNTGFDQVVIRQGDNGQSHWYFKKGAFIAVDAIGAARDYMVGKRLLEMGKTVTADQAGDAQTDLKALLKS